MAKMNWRNAVLAGKPTSSSLDGGLKKTTKTNAEKKRAERAQKKKLYGFFKKHKPEPVKAIDPLSPEGLAIVAKIKS